MKILFVYIRPIDSMRGGVQRVTLNLALNLKEKGSEVSFYSFRYQDCKEAGFQQFYAPNNDFIVCERNIASLCQIVEENNIDVIINQSGLSSEIHNVLVQVKSTTNVKLISCIHNSIFGGVENYGYTHISTFERYHLESLTSLFKLKVVKSLLCKLYMIKYGKHYQLLCEQSDKVVVLTEAMRREIERITGKIYDNIVKIPNGTAIPEQEPLPGRKQNIFLFVGKINYGYKRADLILPIWKRFVSSHPDYKLLFLGDGEKKEELKRIAKKESIPNIYFEGWQDPIPYYKIATGILMTSCSEGLPMVIIEAMSYGVIPFAYNAFPQIREVVEDNVTGMLAEEGNPQEYYEKMALVASDEQRRTQLTETSYIKAQEFDIKKVTDSWNRLVDIISIKKN